MSFDNIGLVIAIAAFWGTVFGVISGYLRSRRDKRERARMTGADQAGKAAGRGKAGKSASGRQAQRQAHPVRSAQR
jgi:hypothetical protein